MKMKPLAYTVFMKMKEKENRHFRMWPPRLGINANLEAISNTHTHISEQKPTQEDKHSVQFGEKVKRKHVVMVLRFYSIVNGRL